ncbi:MAG: hypothetical protein RDU20_11785 [Desulfomonilaceae bacterium]|nr:hypothetical protein [Desulfomonilaceae bacterium]
MKNILIFLVIVIVIVIVVLPGAGTLSSREAKIPCCRLACTCNPKVVECDFKTIEECHDLGGREVMDCRDCVGRNEWD